VSGTLASTPLGRTGLEVSRLGLGTAPLATYFWGNDAATGIATAARAVERGITLFDTAPLYGLGEAELRLGAALPSERSSYVLASKVGRLLLPGAAGELEPVFDFSADAVLASLESSLLRLGLDRIDIVHVHDPDDHLPAAFAGAYPALVELRQQGAIGAVSLGTNSVATATAVLERVDLDVMLVAGRLTMLDRSALDLVARCVERGVAYLAAGVFNSGVLARPYEGSWYDYGPAAPEILERVDRVQRTCEQHGVALRTAALVYPLTVAGVTAVVAGMATPGEVDANIAAMAEPITSELWDALALH
jgi:D-threo-aldose 1-dehydrogenase